MYILGAGLAGLLAANVLRKHNPVILEVQSGLPNNHTSLLRHRENKIAEATSIPFRKVKVTKAINFEGKTYTESSPKLSNLYSHKMTGKYLSRSIDNLAPVDRYIAPPDFISKLAMGCDIRYGETLSAGRLIYNDTPVISTIPMPALWDLCGDISKPDFEFYEIHTASCYIESGCDVFQTVYYPNPDLGLYRLSITGNKVMAEFIKQDYLRIHEQHDVSNLREYIQHFLEHDFGMYPGYYDMSEPKIKTNKYGKISPIDNNIRKQFIHSMTNQYRIFSLGRFATWRNILLDDVYDDILAIQKLITQMGL
jgi:hypothetical protein